MLNRSKLAFLILCFTTAGVVLLDRVFVKIRLGPLFIADAACLICLFLIVFSQNMRENKNLIAILWAPFLFFGVGFLHCAVNLLACRDILTYALFFRIAQHSILYIYPFIWGVLGAWLYSCGWSAGWLLLVLSVSIAGTLLQGIVSGNISVGPLVVVTTIWFLHSAIRFSVKLRQRILWGCAACAAMFLSFWPIWRTWGIHIQRTSFILTLIMFAIVPWLIRKRERNLWIYFGTTSVSYLILILGIAVTHIYLPRLAVAKTSAPQKSINLSLRQDLLKSFQHGEDVSSPRGPVFGFRTRGLMWRSAISEWRKAPFFGVGFIKEIPSYILPGLPNVGGFESSTAPPISGPHNSYLTILARMGIIGFAVFLLFAARLILGAIKILHGIPLSLSSVVLLILPLNGAIHALINVGFESPHHCIIMWIACGILLARTYRSREATDENPSGS